MKSMAIRLFFVVLFSQSVFTQSNTWTCINRDVVTGVSYKSWSALVYTADSNRFISSMGWVFGGSWSPPARHSELAMKLPDTRWINFLPHDSLYGVWSDSTGNTTTAGSNFESPPFKTVNGHLRPAVYRNLHKSFYQYAYDTDNKNIYYYLTNRLIRYSTQLRKWDTLVTSTQPTAIEGGNSPVKWGAMCYDPVNGELLLFGGADVDAKNGNFGTWTYSISSNTWTPLASSVQPPPRCQSQMVYDAKNRSIILFGGDHLDYLMSDTWIYDCETRIWSEKKPLRSPSPRAGHALLFLPKSQAVVLIGGYTYKPASTQSGPSYYNGYMADTTFQMWSYDLSLDEWKLIKSFAASETRPVWLFQSIAAVDTADRIIALGDSSASGGWIKHTYLMECDPTVVDEAGTASRGVMSGTVKAWPGAGNPAWFDSAAGTPNSDSLELVYKNLPLDTWVKMTPPRNPFRGRDWGTRVLSPDHDALLVWSGGHSAYCGSDVPQYSISTNRWHIGYVPELMLELNGDGGNSGSYVNYFTFNNRPFMTGHSYRNYCYSSVHKKMVKHHPSKYTFLYDPVKMDWDTGKVLNPPNDGGGIYNACLTNTPHGAFGWIRTLTGGGGAYYAFYMLDTSMTWNKLDIKGGLTVPTYYTEDGNAMYDSKRDRMLIVSGTERGQVWSYSFQDSTLVKLNPTGDFSSSTNYWREGVYLPAQDKLLLMGNLTHRMYNCATNEWEQLTVTKATGVGTTASVSSGYAYDPKRDLVWDVEQHCEVYVMRVSGGYNPDSIPTTVKSHNNADKNKEIFEVSPNPFNPSISINVATIEKLPVSVKIFDLNGRHVVTLLDNKYVGGSGTVLFWDGSANNTETASGTYLARKYVGKKLVSVIRIVKMK